VCPLTAVKIAGVGVKRMRGLSGKSIGAVNTNSDNRHHIEAGNEILGSELNVVYEVSVNAAHRRLVIAHNGGHIEVTVRSRADTEIYVISKLTAVVLKSLCIRADTHKAVIAVLNIVHIKYANAVHGIAKGEDRADTVQGVRNDGAHRIHSVNGSACRSNLTRLGGNQGFYHLRELVGYGIL
jgi:hypothetical protein